MAAAAAVAAAAAAFGSACRLVVFHRARPADSNCWRVCILPAFEDDLSSRRLYHL